MAVHQDPSLTRERYEEVVRRLTKGKSRFETPADLPFEGLLVHVAAQTDDGFVIFDVFESQQAVDPSTRRWRLSQEVGSSTNAAPPSRRLVS